MELRDGLLVASPPCSCVEWSADHLPLYDPASPIVRVFLDAGGESLASRRGSMPQGASDVRVGHVVLHPAAALASDHGLVDVMTTRTSRDVIPREARSSAEG